MRWTRVAQRLLSITLLFSSLTCGGEQEVDTCGQDCTDYLLNECTCSESDPCNWTADGICDETDCLDSVGVSFSDTTDCDQECLYSANLDLGCDGVIDGCWIAEYNARGYRLNQGRDQGCDGILESDCYTYSYDDQWSRTEKLTDKNCDGRPELCERYGESSLTQDYGCDGSDEYCYAYTYLDGVLQSAEEDISCDGTLDVCGSFFYDENGNRISAQWDYGCNGVPEQCWTATHDEHGNQLTSAWDDDCDGTPDDDCVRYEYDDLGENRVIERYDYDCDGNSDDCLTSLTYECE